MFVFILEMSTHCENVLLSYRNSFTSSVQQLSAAQHANAGGLASYETIQHFNDIKEHLHVVKRSVEHIIQRNDVNS